MATSVTRQGPSEATGSDMWGVAEYSFLHSTILYEAQWILHGLPCSSGRITVWGWIMLLVPECCLTQRPTCSRNQEPHKNTKLKSCNMFAEGLVRTRVDPALASVSVSSYDPGLFIQRALFFCCPPSFLALTLFLPPLLCGSLSSEGRNLMETSHIELRVPRTLRVDSASIPVCCRRKPFQ